MHYSKVFLGAFGYVYEYRHALLKALSVPFILLLILDSTAFFERSTAVGILIFVLAIGVQTIFAINTHRVILLGPDSIPPWGIYKWSKRETLFIVHIFGLMLIMVPVLLLAFIPYIGWLVALCGMFWVAGRFSLVFPGIAIDQGVSFGESWKLTEKYQLLMFLVVIVFPIIVSIPVFLLQFLPYAFFATSIFTAFATVFIVAALSVAYKIISGKEYES